MFTREYLNDETARFWTLMQSKEFWESGEEKTNAALGAYFIVYLNTNVEAGTSYEAKFWATVKEFANRKRLLDTKPQTA